jgi:predicted dehydrogenase
MIPVQEKANLCSSLGVAVVGLGIGALHGRAFHGHPRCQLRAVCDYDMTKAHQFAGEFPSCRVASRFIEILEDESIHVVCIASYDDAHFEQLREALKAGKHVFVEKPLCQNLEQLKEIKKIWIEHGMQQRIGCNMVLRTAPLYQWLKKEIEAGTLGEIYAFDGDYLYGRIGKIISGWRGKIPTYSGFQGGGIHLMDLMLWCTGAHPHTAVAFGNQICTNGTGFSKNDYQTAIIQETGGLTVRISANLGCVHKHHHFIRVFGTQGTFFYDDCGARLHLSRDPDSVSTPITLSPLPKTKTALLEEFLESITEVPSSYEAATQSFLDSTSICIACDEASSTRVPVEVVYV